VVYQVLSEPVHFLFKHKNYWKNKCNNSYPD
jgi:hypothetical protein